ncbi:sugar MFS transporter [Neptunicella sp. SCSIO 80796]|uniref:sugar MFS transporter n=1 Tax=Neptunicella plasticusilytica TaxID=3117012 RepID=UPI003A4D6402
MHHHSNKSTALLSLLIIATLFFIFGFITWLNGALIPFLQIVCELTPTESLVVAFSFYIAYVVMALPMAKVIERFGLKNAMCIGLTMIAAGALLFVPAALSRQFALFLCAQFVLGAGLTILQTAANPYLVVMGDQKTAAVRISIMGVLNKSAGVLAPIAFTSLVLSDFADVSVKSIELLSVTDKNNLMSDLSASLIMPYCCMALVLLVMALLLKFSPLPDIDMHNENAQDKAQQSVSLRGLLHFPHLIFGVIALFLYVGAEVIAGDTIGLVGSKLGLANATSLTSFTMAFMVAGYLCGLVLIPRLLSQEKALASSAVIGMIVTIFILCIPSDSFLLSHSVLEFVSNKNIPDIIYLIAFLGFANAIVWPAIWPMALKGLGAYTAKGSAVLIMAIAGGAIMPLVYGGLSSVSSIFTAYAILLPCYLFILFYAIKGHKVARQPSANKPLSTQEFAND